PLLQTLEDLWSAIIFPSVGRSLIVEEATKIVGEGILSLLSVVSILTALTRLSIDTALVQVVPNYPDVRAASRALLITFLVSLTHVIIVCLVLEIVFLLWASLQLFDGLIRCGSIVSGVLFWQRCGNCNVNGSSWLSSRVGGDHIRREAGCE